MLFVKLNYFCKLKSHRKGENLSNINFLAFFNQLLTSRSSEPNSKYRIHVKCEEFEKYSKPLYPFSFILKPTPPDTIHRVPFAIHLETQF